MAVSGINPDALQELARTFTARFDTDKNGQVSPEEFINVFRTLLSGPAAARSAALPSTAAAFSGPRAIAGTLGGYDPVKLANPDHQTTKYQIGRILQYYPNTPQGLRDALPEIQQIAPNVTIKGSSGDKLDFGEYIDKAGIRIGVIDVLQGAASGGHHWQWLPIE